MKQKTFIQRNGKTIKIDTEETQACAKVALELLAEIKAEQTGRDISEITAEIEARVQELLK